MSLENPFASKEDTPITREKVLETLKQKGKEESALELLQTWIDQNREEIRTIENLKEQIDAEFAFDIQRLKLYIEAGFLAEARTEIIGEEGQDGMLDAPVSEKLIDQLKELLQEIDAKLAQ